MADDLGLDLRADPPKPPRWSRADIGCAGVLALFFGFCVTCILAPTHNGFLDEANVEATHIALRKLAGRIDATGAPPTPEGFEALAGDVRDAWGNRIQYTGTCDDGRGTYVLRSVGRNGRDDGDDVVIPGPITRDISCRR